LLLITLFNLTALSLINAIYNVLPGSLIQLLRGVKVALTCLLSKLVLGTSSDNAKLLGVGMNMVGLVFVVVSSYGSVRGPEAGDQRKLWVALGLGMLSQLVGSCQSIYEKRTMDTYSISPVLLTGMEGIIGTPIAFCMLLVANFLGLEDTLQALQQMAGSSSVTWLMVALLICLGTFNLSGISVTKFGSPVLRALLEIGRTACIWLIEVTWGWLHFQPSQLVAYMLTSFGTLVYGKFIRIPCLPALQ